MIHTMGWPLRGGAKSGSSAARSSTRWAKDMVTIGMVVGLDYRDTELSVHDLLQELKTHKRIRKILDGGAARWSGGRRRFPRAGSCRCRSG